MKGYAQYPQWGKLQPGQYEVGFKTIMTVDYSRNYFPQIEEAKPVRGRPLQLYVWYPAQKGNGKYMRYKMYFDYAAKDVNQPDSLALKAELIREFRSGPLSPYFPNGVIDKDWQTIANTSTACLYNALPVAGKFPVVIHIGPVTAQSILLEYLASYGYVVITIPLMGSSPAFYGRGENNLSLLYYQADDIEFVINQLSRLPEADVNKLAMVGMFAQTGIHLQSKSGIFDAVALLESFLHMDLHQLPYFKLSSIRIPVLEIINSDRDKDTSMVDTMHYAARYRVKFKNMPHAEFYPFAKIANQSEGNPQKHYDLAALYTLQFLNAALKKDQKGEKFISAQPKENGLDEDVLSVVKTPARPVLPTEGEFLSWVRADKLDLVQKAWQQARSSGVTVPLFSKQGMQTVIFFMFREPEKRRFDYIKIHLANYPADPPMERILNYEGYKFIKSGNLTKAKEIFEYYTSQFPKSPYAFSGLADLYNALQDKPGSIRSSQMCIALANQSNSLNEQQKKELIDSAEAIIKKYQQ
ncbi:hypothetical protein GXP67_04555 [Rhodocytophaga rosea]|uniref:Alpha/beta hydrolase n=1 Tax=Rhodocytophaga rosea TaxID=2704465 RepID=A0A6C0GDF8_9BACT|nr:hypothetical protein [Rhodocytophaga rosea]QHT65991.1 hypothetical protein GXP67_04555 [Rhodocytophaga rosea]